jgi:hypothetical protein
MAPVRAFQQPLRTPSLPILTSTPLLFPSSIPFPHSRFNSNTNSLRLRNNTLTNALQTQPTQPQLTLLNLRNLINMLQTNRPYNFIQMPPLQLPLNRFHLSRT